MPVSHALSEKAIKRMGLDKIEKPDPIKSKEVVQEWNSPREYWDWQEKKWDEENKKFSKKFKDFWKYSVYYRLRDWYYNTKWYFRNLKTFQPVLKTWRSFDYHYQIDLFKFGIVQLANALNYYGNTEETERNKCISAMKALIAEIDRDYEEDVRTRLGYDCLSSGKVTLYADGSTCMHSDKSKEHKKKSKEYYAEIAKERKLHYKKIFDLIIGKDYEEKEKEYKKRIKELTSGQQTLPEEELTELKRKIWDEINDGSGIEGWFD